MFRLSKTYHVWDLIQMSEEDIWQLPHRNYTVIFSDKEITLTGRQIILSWYYWDMFRMFDTAPVTSKCCVSSRFHSTLPRKLGGELIWHIYDYLEPSGTSIWPITEKFCRVNNNIYNMSCVKLQEYVTSVSLHDVIEILSDPDLLEAKRQYRVVEDAPRYNELAFQNAIENIYKVLNDIMYSRPEYMSSNGIKKLAMLGLLNKGNMNQFAGIRGYCSDVEKSVFHLPIGTCFAEGMNNLYDLGVESRSASTADMMAEEPLEQSEYFNRRIQLATSVILGVDNTHKSCTGFLTVPYLVFGNDYTLLKGKYHMVNGVPELIWDSIDHLVGKVIHLRSLLACGCRNVQYVCPTCLGKVAVVVPPETNLGFMLSTILCSAISQIILSTKHYLGSSSNKQFVLNMLQEKWFRINPKTPNDIYLRDDIQKNITLELDSKALQHLDQINHIDVRELSPPTISQFTTLLISMLDKDGEVVGEYDILRFDLNGGQLHLTHDFLEYIKLNGWNTSKKTTMFNLSEWNTHKPIFGIPRKSDDIMSFFEVVKSFMDPEKETRVKVTDYATRGQALTEMITLLRRRLNETTGESFNIIQVESFLRAAMMVNFNKREYRLPHPSEEFQFVKLRQAIMYRSFTSMLAYQGQYESILSTHWQTDVPETDHMMDNILEV